jgi:pimeloyl-ACP methyl ester carboxylesterase
MWIPTAGGQVFAWYHPAAAGRWRDCAVLLCDPFGWQRMVLHLPYRHLALRLAAAGFSVLRVDYPGTCDSEGWPRESARVETWLRSLDEALRALKAWSNASHLALFGALLGGTVAAALAARRQDVSALALWGAYARGRTAVRAELAVAEALQPHAQASASPASASGDREAVGFLLSAEMMADLTRLDLLQMAFGGVRSALIVPRTRGSSAEAGFARHLAGQGATVDFRAEPHDELDAILHQGGAGNPRATIEDIAAWLELKFGPAHHAPAARTAPLCPPEVALSTLGTRIRESAVFLGADRGIFAIASEGLERPAQEPAVVLVSGGRNHRSGINRNYTEWARKLAALGHTVLRIDVRGLGDSPPKSHRTDALYNVQGRHDVLDAVDWLKARGFRRAVCVGLCAGSYQAFHAALNGDSLAGVVMLNPLAFHADRANDTDRPSRLQKLARRIARRLQRAARRVFPNAAILTRAERRIARSFVDLCERGVDVCIIYNDDEPYLDFLQRALRPIRDRLDAGGRFRIDTVEGSDHLHSPLAAQAQVTELLLRYVAELARRPKPAHEAEAVRPADVVLQSGAGSRL